MLEKILTNKVYIVGTIVKQLKSMQILPVKMKIFFLKKLGSQRIKEIEDAWTKESSPDLMRSVRGFIKKDNLLLLTNVWLKSKPFSTEVTSACYKSHIKSWTTNPAMSSHYHGSVPPTRHHTEISYGDAVRSWMYSNQGPSKYDLLIPGKTPANIVRHSYVENPFSCFIGECQVLCDDSNTVEIKDLKENDQILGDNGVVGTVSSEKVINQFENPTPIYGFNDIEPFFTAGHPFLTQDGWRAIDPHLAKKENHWLEVGQLSEGDYVKKAVHVNGNKISYEWVKIETIHSKVIPAGAKVYGVHLREGPRSYHANGFVVCLNYPEITLQNAAERMNNLSTEEKKHLQEHMNVVQPLLEKVLGSGPAKAMKGLTQKYLADKISKKMHQAKNTLPLKEISLHHLNLSYKAGKTEHESYTTPSKMSIFRGKLFLDDQHVPEASVSENNKVSWTRNVPDGRWEHGSVKLLGSGNVGHGYVALTETQGDTKPLISANFMASANVNDYNCYKSKNAISSESSTTTDWEEVGEVEMGTDCSSGSCKIVGKIKLPGMDDFDDLGYHVVFGVNSNQQTTVNVTVPPDYWSFLGYTKFSGIFNWDFSSFSGTCIQYDASKSGGEGETFSWRGTIEKDLTTEAMVQASKTASLNENVKTDALVQASNPVSLNENLKTEAFVQASKPVSLNENFKIETLIQPESVSLLSSSPEESSEKPEMLKDVETLTDEHLSVDELYLITPPDSQSLHEQTFDLLQQCTKYAMDDDLRENVFGIVKPSLDGDQAAVADKYKEFFGGTFANAYTMNGLANSSNFKDKITDEQRNKLLYYWAGNDENSLAQNPDYNKANNEASRLAFIELCPTVKRYMTSSEGSAYWAKQLYDKLNEIEVLNGLALDAEVSQTTEIIQKQSMVLFSLAPDEDYGAQFYKTILVTRLQVTSTYFDGGDDDTMKEIFTDSLYQLVLKILQGGDDLTREVISQMNEQLQAVIDEYNIDATKSNEECAEEVTGHLDDMVTEIIDLFNMKKGMGWDKLAESLSEWRTNNPKYTTVGNFLATGMSIAFYSAAFVITMYTFMNWKDLTPEQQAAVCFDGVDLTVSGIAKVPDMLEGFKSLYEGGKQTISLIKNKMKMLTRDKAIEEMVPFSFPFDSLF